MKRITKREKVINIEILMCKPRGLVLRQGIGMVKGWPRRLDLGTLMFALWHWNWVLFIIAAWIVMLGGEGSSVAGWWASSVAHSDWGSVGNDWRRGKEPGVRYCFLSCFCCNLGAAAARERLTAYYFVLVTIIADYYRWIFCFFCDLNFVQA